MFWPSPVAPAIGHGGRYVYGIIEARENLNFGKMGIGGSGEMVYTVHYNDMAAVVSQTDVVIFDPTRENALGVAPEEPRGPLSGKVAAGTGASVNLTYGERK